MKSKVVKVLHKEFDLTCASKFPKGQLHAEKNIIERMSHEKTGLSKSQQCTLLMNSFVIGSSAMLLSSTKEL